MSYQDFLQRRLMEALMKAGQAPVGNPFQGTPYRSPVAGPMPQEVAPAAPPGHMNAQQIGELVAQKLSESPARSIPRQQYAQPPGPPAPPPPPPTTPLPQISGVFNTGLGGGVTPPLQVGTDASGRPIVQLGTNYQGLQVPDPNSGTGQMLRTTPPPSGRNDLFTEETFHQIRDKALAGLATGIQQGVRALPTDIGDPLRKVGHVLHSGMDVINKPFMWNVGQTGETMYQVSQNQPIEHPLDPRHGYGWLVDSKARDFAHDPANQKAIADAYHGHPETDAAGNTYVYAQDGDGHKKGDPILFGYVAKDTHGNIIATFDPGAEAVWELYSGSTNLGQKAWETVFMDPLSIPELLAGGGEIGKSVAAGMRGAELLDDAAKAGRVGKMDRTGRIMDFAGRQIGTFSTGLTMPQAGIEAGLALPFKVAGAGGRRVWTSLTPEAWRGQAAESRRITEAQDLQGHATSPVVNLQNQQAALIKEHATTVERVEVPGAKGGTQVRWQVKDADGNPVGTPVRTKADALRDGKLYTDRKVAETQGLTVTSAPQPAPPAAQAAAAEQPVQPAAGATTATVEPPTVVEPAPPTAAAQPEPATGRTPQERADAYYATRPNGKGNVVDAVKDQIDSGRGTLGGFTDYDRTKPPGQQAFLGEADLDKWAAYTEVANELGYDVGPITIHDNAGTFDAPLTPRPGGPTEVRVPNRYKNPAGTDTYATIEEANAAHQATVSAGLRNVEIRPNPNGTPNEQFRLVNTDTGTILGSYPTEEEARAAHELATGQRLPAEPAPSTEVSGAPAREGTPLTPEPVTTEPLPPVEPAAATGAEPNYDNLAKYTTKTDRNAAIRRGTISVYDPVPSGGRLIDRAAFGIGADNVERRSAFFTEVQPDLEAHKARMRQLDEDLSAQVAAKEIPLNQKVATEAVADSEFVAEVITPAYQKHFGDLDPLTEMPQPGRHVTRGKPISFARESDTGLIQAAVFSRDSGTTARGILAGRWEGKSWRDDMLARIDAARAQAQAAIGEVQVAPPTAEVTPPVAAAAPLPTAEVVPPVEAAPPTDPYANLPPVSGGSGPTAQRAEDVAPPGMTRLYRVEVDPAQRAAHPDWIQQAQDANGHTAAKDRWFVTDPSMLDWYRTDIGHPEVTRTVYVDVPTAELEQYRVANVADAGARNASRDPQNEFFLPRDLADARQPLTFRPEETGGVTPPGGVDALGPDQIPGDTPDQKSAWAQAANESRAATISLTGKPVSPEVPALPGTDPISLLQQQAVITTDEVQWWLTEYDVPENYLKPRPAKPERQVARAPFGRKTIPAVGEIPTVKMSAADLYLKMVDLHGEDQAYRAFVGAMKGAGYGGVDWAKQLPFIVKAIDKVNAYFGANIMFGVATGIKLGLTDGLSDVMTGYLLGGAKLAARNFNLFDKFRVWQTVRTTGEHALNGIKTIRNFLDGTGITLPPDLDSGLLREAGDTRHLIGTGWVYKVAGEGALGKGLHGIGTAAGLLPSKVMADFRRAIGEHTRLTFFHHKFQEIVAGEAKTRFGNSVEIAATKAGAVPADWANRILETARERAGREGWEFQGWNFSPEDVRVATGDENLARSWAHELNEAKREATAFMHKGLFNYGEFSKTEAFFKRTFLFSFWHSHQLRLYGRLALENPWLTASMWRMWKGLQNKAEREGLPIWAHTLFKFMGNMDGQYHLTNAVAMFFPYAMIDNVFRDDQGYSGDNTLDKILKRVPVPLSPALDAAATVLAIKHGNPVNAIGSQQTRNMIRYMISSGPALGIDFLRPVQGAADPIDAWERKIEESIAKRAGSVVPLAHYEKFFGGTNTEKRTLNDSITHNMEQEYGSKWTDWAHMGAEGQAHLDEMAAAQKAIEDDNTENPRANQARDQYYGARGGIWAALNATMPGGVVTRYGPYDRDRQLDQQYYDASKTAGSPAVTTLPGDIKATTTTPTGEAAISTGPTAEEQQAHDTLSQAGSAQPEMTSLGHTYSNLGSKEQQKTYDLYNKIAFAGFKDDEVAVIDGQMYSKAYLKRHPDLSRQLADRWVDQSGQRPAIDAVQGLQDDFVAAHPEMSGFKDYQSAMRDAPGGAAAGGELIAAYSPAFKDYWDKSQKDDLAATSVDAYLAQKGLPLNIGDETLPATDISKVPAINFLNGGGGGGGGGNKPYDPVASLTKDIANYNERLGAANQFSLDYTHGRADYEHLDTFAKQYVDQQLDIAGVKPYKSATMTYYEYWRDNIAKPGSDTSPGAFIAWRQKYLGGDLSNIQALADQAQVATP